MRFLCQDHRSSIGANMTGDARKDIDSGAIVDFQIQLRCRQVQGCVGCERKRRAAEFDRADAEKQVVHDWIASDGDFDNVFSFYATFLCDLPN